MSRSPRRYPAPRSARIAFDLAAGCLRKYFAAQVFPVVRVVVSFHNHAQVSPDGCIAIHVTRHATPIIYCSSNAPPYLVFGVTPCLALPSEHVFPHSLGREESSFLFHADRLQVMTTYLLTRLHSPISPAERLILRRILLGVTAGTAAVPDFGQTSRTIAAPPGSMTHQLPGSAQAQPGNVPPLFAAETVVLSGLSVVSERHVHAGQTLRSPNRHLLNNSSSC